MEEFRNPEPLEYGIEDIKGNRNVVKTVKVSCQEMKAMTMKVAEIKDPYDKMTYQLSVMFGKPQEFFEAHDSILCRRLLNKVTEDMMSPLKPQK